MKKLLLAAAACCVAAVAVYSSAPSQTTPPDERGEPNVRVREQPGAPLRVTFQANWPLAGRPTLEVFFVVANVGDRPVRSYAVRGSGGVAGALGPGCYFRSAEKKGKILQPGRSQGTSTWWQGSPSGPQPEIELALDFVEFNDGSTWGEDSCQGAETLDGLRAGARVARREFGRRLSARGLDALLRELNPEDPALAPPPGRAEKWRAGFEGAIRSFHERLRRANVEGGLPDVEEALRQPFDASEDQ
jgi:hypothetical protein